MTHGCTISCPACRCATKVLVTGTMTCAACGEEFEVGVYSPTSDRRWDQVELPGGLRMRDGWLCVGRRSYSMVEIAGANLTPRTSGFRLFAAGVSLFCAVTAALEGRWPFVLVAGVALLWLLHSIRVSSRQYVVSWITRGGREGCHCVGSREDAECLVAFIQALSAKLTNVGRQK